MLGTTKGDFVVCCRRKGARETQTRFPTLETALESLPQTIALWAYYIVAPDGTEYLVMQQEDTKRFVWPHQPGRA